MRKAPRVWLAAGLLALGCGPTEPAAVVTVQPAPSPPMPSTTPSSAAPSSAPSTTAPARAIGDDDPLRAGRVRFDGMVQPTKGGVTVRGVVFSAEALKEALAKDGPSPTYDDLLGAKLRVVAELVERSPDPPDGDVTVQRRSGPGFDARELVSAELVSAPVMIEGEVRRSKGLFAVGSHMVSRDDLAWSLPGQDPMGKKVRLWGQPRIYRCPPQAQCLIGGSIPMFDVGRAELVK